MGMLDYTITRTDNPTSAEELSEILANPGFGKHFTDHMVTTVSYTHLTLPTSDLV